MTEAANLLAIGVLLVMLGWIGLLPRLFFRPGRRNLQWWLNALPFWAAGATLVAAALGVVEPLRPSRDASALSLSVASLGVSAASARLLSRTLATHERALALWHQTDDRAEHLVTSGPYAYIRHPFYASFILTLAACVLAAPHPLTLAALAVGAYRLSRTALAEEKRLVASDVGEAYTAYMRSTGRFLPRR